MKNVFLLFILTLLTACQTGSENPNKNDNANFRALPDTTFGFSKVQITQEIKKGVLHEYKQYYFPDGSIAMQGEFVNFVKENWWEEYHATGKIKSRGTYVNNKKQGDWMMYFENGNL
ncbi:MAG: antitoxin component YwqK of YwqJK toxin-antitoxin module, partial [Saprospiraceae bacterium]